MSYTRTYPQRVQVCATCAFLRYEKREGERALFWCARLRFPTRPQNRFRCWTPRDPGQRGILPKEP